MNSGYVCSVDVGTASARAGIFDRNGRQIARAEHPILLNEPAERYAEHSSEDIWMAVCAVVKAARASAAIKESEVVGLCFDTTCSLVIRGERGGLPVSPGGEARWDTISWFDHRALAEADECTATGHEVLDYVGGVMSPEMQAPKLMWLKRNCIETWRNIRHAFDLADFLTWKATGSDVRSQCTVTCKWTYLPHKGGWQADFFDAVGLGDLATGGSLAAEVRPVGARIGALTASAAAELDLAPNCVVATGLIDAYAGMLGSIGPHAEEADGERHVALVAGTSSCIMRLARTPSFVSSIWGPYFGAGPPGLWASEGGQSATGALLDHVIQFSRNGIAPNAADHQEVIRRIGELRAAEPDLAANLHVLPDFNGNRSPLADPHALGAIYGLGLDSSFDAVCKLYWRTCVAIALGVRQIVDHLREHGQAVELLHVIGGHLRNPLLMELYADMTLIPAAQPETEDAVLLGGAMAAAAAVGWYADVPSACRAMRSRERIRQPDPARQAASDRDYAIFLTMQDHRRQIQALSRTLRITGARADPMVRRDRRNSTATSRT